MVEVSPIAQLLELWYPSVQEILTEHDQLPSHKQAGYRAEQARLGNWELAATVALRSYYTVSTQIMAATKSYWNRPNAEWAGALRDRTDQGQRNLANRARGLAETMPSWAKTVIENAINEFVNLDITELDGILSALRGLHSALSIALVLKSGTYLDRTRSLWTSPIIDELLDRTVPSLELKTMLEWGLALASPTLSKSNVGQFLLNIAREGLDELDLSNESIQMSIHNSLEEMENTADDEILLAFVTSQVGIALGAVETAIEAIEEIKSLPSSFREGLTSTTERAKAKAVGKKGTRKDVLAGANQSPSRYKGPDGLFKWETTVPKKSSTSQSVAVPVSSSPEGSP